MVFEKLNDTFARRHHLRIWLRPDRYQGRPVWVVAATHDMGISFSEANRTFIHRIDSSIDRERDKVANDLVLAGHVASMLLVDRSAIPQNAQSATGDNLVTDGKIAAILLSPAPSGNKARVLRHLTRWHFGLKPLPMLCL